MGIAHLESLFDAPSSHKGVRTDTTGTEARTFFVSTTKDVVDRLFMLDTMLFQRPDDLEPRENTEDPIESATKRLGIQVASRHDRYGVRDRPA